MKVATSVQYQCQYPVVEHLPCWLPQKMDRMPRDRKQDHKEFILTEEQTHVSDSSIPHLSKMHRVPHLDRSLFQVTGSCKKLSRNLARILYISPMQNM